MKEFGYLILLCVAFVVGFLLCAATKDVEAHPCDDTYEPPKCGYVQVVNIDGILVQEYVCK